MSVWGKFQLFSCSYNCKAFLSNICALFSYSLPINSLLNNVCIIAINFAICTLSLMIKLCLQEMCSTLIMIEVYS